MFVGRTRLASCMYSYMLLTFCRGIDHNRNILRPQLVYDLCRAPIRSIAAGGRHCLLVTVYGECLAVGNDCGKLGLGEIYHRSRPEPIKALWAYKIVGVAAGYNRSFVLVE